MQNTPIKPISPTVNSTAGDLARNDKAAAQSSPPSVTADSVIVSVPAPRPKLQESSDPSSLVASLTKALSSPDAISSAHGNLDTSRVHELLSED
jgi:hypothetical protein